MFLLCCCGDSSEPVVNAITTRESQPEPVDEPIVIEPLPDVGALQLAHPSALPEKPEPVATHAPAPQPASVPRNWEVFEETSPRKEAVSTPSPPPPPPPPAAAADPQQPSKPFGENVDMHNALDERISTREYILSITDDKLSRLPVAFIESFYPHLSPGEIMQLEQRLCDLKTRILSAGHPEPLPIESENFLKSYHPQITIRTDTGFQVDNKRSSQNGLDIRQLILAARNQKISSLDAEVLRQLQPFLSVVEFQDISNKTSPQRPPSKQQLDLQLSDPKKESSAASSYVFNAPALNSDIYHLTTEPSFSADGSVCSDDTTEHNADAHPPPPLIKVTDMDPENNVIGEPNEQAVKSLVDDILLKL